MKMPHSRDCATTPRMLVLHLENENFYEIPQKIVMQTISICLDMKKIAFMRYYSNLPRPEGKSAIL